MLAQRGSERRHFTSNLLWNWRRVSWLPASLPPPQICPLSFSNLSLVYSEWERCVKPGHTASRSQNIRHIIARSFSITSVRFDFLQGRSETHPRSAGIKCLKCVSEVNKRAEVQYPLRGLLPSAPSVTSRSPSCCCSELAAFMLIFKYLN